MHSAHVAPAVICIGLTVICLAPQSLPDRSHCNAAPSAPSRLISAALGAGLGFAVSVLYILLGWMSFDMVYCTAWTALLSDGHGTVLYFDNLCRLSMLHCQAGCSFTDEIPRILLAPPLAQSACFNHANAEFFESL